MPLLSFRDSSDPDERRKEILWTAISFIVILASWLAVVLTFGYRPLALGMTYDEVVLVCGLGLLVFCSVLYLIGKEREQRFTNKRLVAELQLTVASLDERVRQLNGLCSISADLAGSLAIDEISQYMLDALKESLRADRAHFILLDSKTGHPVFARNTNGDRGEEPTAPLPEMVWPGRMDAGTTRLVDVQAQVQKWNAHSDLACAHFRCKDSLTGILAARRAEGQPPFTADDLSILTTLSNMAAKALESAHLHSELRENYLATVKSLVLSLHARDNYAATHSQRVAALACSIAEHMGLAESAIRDIEVFAPLHDVGKIGIRDDILLKKGLLTEEEKNICREHCVIGDRIVRPLKPTREALALVRNHHESWDGRGYPDALAGEEIPLLARILKVADCYDALISERPYGAVVSEGEALAHFRLHADTYYDPTVVEALVAVLGHDEPRARSGASLPGRPAVDRVAALLPARPARNPSAVA